MEESGTHHDEFGADELADLEDVVVLAAHAQQKGNGVADVTHDELNGKWGVVDVEVAAPPGEEAVDEADEGDDTEEDGGDHAGNLDAGPGAVGEGVQGVRGLGFLVVMGHDDAAGGESFLLLGPAQLRSRERGGDAHDAGGDESLRVDAHADVGDEDGAGDGGVAGTHDLVDLGSGEVGDEGLDEHGGLALADEGGCGGGDGLGAGDAHAPEEENGELADGPLEHANVVEQLDDGHEEHDGRDHADDEPGAVVGGVVGDEEVDALHGEAEEAAREHGDEVEDVVAGLGAEHEERDDELHQHSDDDGVPDNEAVIARRQPEREEEDDEPKEADGPVGARVVGRFIGDERTDQDNTDGKEGGAGNAKTLGDEGHKPPGCLVPEPVDWASDDGDGHVEEDKPQRDGEVEEEGNQPAEIMSVEDEAGNPPSTHAPGMSGDYLAGECAIRLLTR